jgi:putative membrane protein
MRDELRNIQRPHSKLLLYYALTSLVLGPLFPILLVPRYFRYHTLRYDFGDDGISMRWGLLFGREVHLTYPRIQDIHLRSNVIERWLGLGRLLIQTASGSSKAEMTIEGVLEFEELRDFIYERMRDAGDAGKADAVSTAANGSAQDLTGVLQSVAGELREIRKMLERDTGR